MPPQDCHGGEDEADCSPAATGRCEPSEFTCGDGTCVPTSFLCDGNRDCLDGSDEKQADCSVHCTSKERACASGSKCIPSQYWCDGDEDCEDGSDEKSCTMEVECAYPNLTCDKALNRTKCLEVSRLCDGVQDCKDSSDEGLLCGEQQCKSTLNQCSHGCRDSPSGHRCTCPSSQSLASDRVTCTGIHPCSQWGACSQLCKQVSRVSHKCYCQPGYQLQPDRFTCKSKDPDAPVIVFSNRHELRQIDLRRRVVHPLISSLKDTIVVDFLHEEKRTLLYWTDWADDAIYSGTLAKDASLSNIEMVVHSSLTTAEGLAVDWIGGNLYWIQSSLDQIEVSRLNGSFRQTLIAGKMERPRALALEPREGMLFWTDWDPAGSPRIERCSMDGREENRMAIYNVSNYGGAWPNGLTVDYQARRIYWTDARSDSIHTAKYDGSDPREVLRGHQYLSHPFSLAVFESHIYWTDWRSSSVIRANKWNGTDVQIIERTISKPFGLRVVHPSVQPAAPKPHPCTEDNGGCSHLCLLGYNQTRTCACPHVMRLARDSVTCETNRRMLLFSSHDEIRGVELERPYHHLIPPLPPPHALRPRHLAFLASKQQIYWVDKAGAQWPQLAVVRRATVAGEDSKVGVVMDLQLADSSSQQSEGLAIDWISRTMFYVGRDEDREEGSCIYAARLDGTGVARVRCAAGLVRGLLVLPPLGLLAWHSLQLENGSETVQVASMDGTSLRTVHTVKRSSSEDPTLISCLSSNSDWSNPNIFWVNKRSPSVEGYSLRTHTPIPALHLGNTTALTAYRSMLYFANFSLGAGAIYRLELSEELAGEAVAVRTTSQEVISLAVYDPGLQEGSNGCTDDNGGCEQLCMPVNSSTSRCMCTIGYHVSAFSRTECRPVPDLLVYALDNRLRGLAMSPPSYSSALAPASNIGHPTSITFLAKQQLLFWADQGVGIVWRMRRDGTEKRMVLKELDSPAGLVIDWVAELLYWTDDRTDLIEVCKLDGSSRKVIISGRLSRPGPISVSPEEGILVWADTDPSLPRLETARQDGSGRRLLYSDPRVAAITSIAIDPASGWLYFCNTDPGTGEGLARIRYASTTEEELKYELIQAKAPELLLQPRAITVLDNQLWWSDIRYKEGSISYLDLSLPGNVHTVKQNLGGATFLRDITMVSPRLQQDSNTNPCRMGANPCSELCLFNGSQPVCQCAHRKLAEDGTTCVDHKAFVVFSRISDIESLHIEVEEGQSPPFPLIHSEDIMRNAIGLAYSYSQKLIFYSDIQSGSINSVQFNGSSHRRLLSGLGSVEGLAYDGVRGFLYWTSTSDSTIKRVEVKQRF